MKPKYQTDIRLIRFRIDAPDLNKDDPVYIKFEDTLTDWLIKNSNNILCTKEVSSAAKLHYHAVFSSTDKLTAIRTRFKRQFPSYRGSQYSFSQNWSKETKSKDMELYMEKHELNYQDIHIIYILKDSDIKLNSLIENAVELDFEEIRTEIGAIPKNQKKYGNYTKRLIMEYNEKYPEPLIDVNCGSLDDFPEKERIFKFVTRQMASHNLNIFLSNAKKFDDYVIKMLCQTLLNTRKYGDFYPDYYRDEVLKYFL